MGLPTTIEEIYTAVMENSASLKDDAYAYMVVLRKLFSGKDEVRKIAAELLARTGEEGVLFLAFRDERSATVREAILELAYTIRNIPIVWHALDDESPIIRKKAQEYILRMYDEGDQTFRRAMYEYTVKSESGSRT